MSPIDHPTTRRFIEDAGNTTQALGVGRVVGQLYAYLYFSGPPRTLDDMKEALGISKGSASMGMRQLEQWGAVQRIWVKGDRKDYYAANDYFGQIVRNIAVDLMGKRLAGLSESLDAAEAELNGGQSEGSVGGALRAATGIGGGRKSARIAAAERASHIEEGNSNHEFLKARVQRLREFQRKVNKTWNNPIVKMMLK